MLFAALGFALLCLALAVRLFSTRKQLESVSTSLASETEQSERSRTELKDTIERARQAENEATEARRELTSMTETLAMTTDELANASEDVADLNRELDEADKLAADQAAELASMAIEAEDLNCGLAAARDELAVAQRQQAAGGQLNGTAVDPETLWKLELARSERTWRYSVALLPDDTSPFGDAPDLLALAVETEAAALRDEVGAFLSVDWRAAPVDDPARSHLILRLAQELLAKAARLEEPTRLVAEDDSQVEEETDVGLTLRLEPTEEGDVIRLDLHDLRDESLGSDGIVRTQDDDSLTITVLR